LPIQNQQRSDTTAVINVQGLFKRFGSFVAVDNVNLNVAPGEVFGLLGANGAGKTTVIRMLCGTLAPTRGQMSVAGIDMVRQPRHARGHIGYVTQGFTLYDDLTVQENLTLQAGLYGLNGNGTRQRIDWALDYLDLKAHAPLMARELPLGYQRRLSLAAALLHQPQVLFLDEPTSGVDPLARQHFWELIYDLADSGIGILVTTHYMDEAAFCDRLALMHAGKVVEQATPQALLDKPLSTPIVELQTEHCDDCLALLSNRPEVHEVIPHAGRLRIRLQANTDSDSFIKAIRNTADQQGTKITAIDIATPGLEDVFVAVLEQAGENH
jgi:ABC-2 type transport system ATP-binding protein